MNRISAVFLASAVAACLAATIATAPAVAEEPPKAAVQAQSAVEPAAAEKTKGQAFLAKVDTEKDVRKMPSGLRIKTVRVGDGWSPASTDTVRVHYRGKLTDGTEFDSSYKRDAPATFPLMGVIACWTEGLQLMKSGGKATLYCPPEIAYGEKGHPPVIPPAATLVFDVELLEIVGGKSPGSLKKPQP